MNDLTSRAVAALIAYVDESCACAVAESTGFHNARVVNARRDVARETFTKAIRKLDQEEGS